MKLKTIVVLLLVAGLIAGVVYAGRIRMTQNRTALPSPASEELSSRITCIPTFADGGGPYYVANSPFRNNLAPEGHGGEELVVTGRVLKTDCITPIPGAVVDVWQANESGNYEDEWYRGRVTADENGNYTFNTVVPQGYGSGSGFRPPHIHFKIWQDNQLLITSQMFLPESRNQNINEAYIMRVESDEKDGIKTHRGFHNIIVP